jgi:dTDP-4-dehydrorhamnose reductase
MANVLVTGATGLLGSALVPLLRRCNHQVTSLGYSHAADINVDLISYDQTMRALDQVRPEIIINLTALTDVDRCETHPQEAYLLNVKLVENLCSWMPTPSAHCHLIHISSDQLYDGPGPHSEDEVTIRNHYGMSKLAGEFSAGRVSSTILRTNFIGRSERDGRVSFTDWLYGALRRGESINVFDDVMFSPLAMGTLCDCIERCIVKKPRGVFNLGSRDGLSKADFAFAFADAIGLSKANLVRSNSNAVGALSARRPTDMRMQCDRFENLMKIKLPRLLDEIHVLASDY